MRKRKKGRARGARGPRAGAQARGASWERPCRRSAAVPLSALSVWRNPNTAAPPAACPSECPGSRGRGRAAGRRGGRRLRAALGTDAPCGFVFAAAPCPASGSTKVRRRSSWTAAPSSCCGLGDVNPGARLSAYQPCNARPWGPPPTHRGQTDTSSCECASTLRTITNLSSAPLSFLRAIFFFFFNSLWFLSQKPPLAMPSS